MVHTIKAQVSEPKEVYSLDDVIEGLVIGNFQKEIDVQEVALKAKCFVWVDVIDGNNFHDVQTDNLFEFSQRVFPPADVQDAMGSSSFTIRPGHYEWPFRLDLNQFAHIPMPPSSAGRGRSFLEMDCHYKVEFSFKAVVRRESMWKSNLRDKHTFKCTPCVDVEYLEHAPIQTVVSELEFRLRDYTKSTSLFSRAPKLPNRIVAELDMPAAIPQLPRRMGLSLRLKADLEVKVESIKCTLYQRVFVKGKYYGSSVKEKFVVGDTSPRVAGKELDLTPYVADFACSAIHSYQHKLLRCQHRLEIVIALADPQTPSKKAKLVLDTGASILSSEVHRHNAPLYEVAMREGKTLERAPPAINGKEPPLDGPMTGEKDASASSGKA